MATTSIGLRQPSLSLKEDSRHEMRPTSEMLLDAASRNPSLVGRELVIEIISRGYERERDSAPDLRGNLREAISPREGFTRAEHADLLGREHKLGRDLYEHGAMIKGSTLIIPAEAHELSEERDSPFLISISYALGKIHDREKAERFVELGLAIIGETADTETRLTVFKHYYNQITKDERGRYLKGEERATAIERTLAEMTGMAAQMKALETSQDDLTRRTAGSIEQMRESERISQAGSEEERERLWLEDHVNDRREESDGLSSRESTASEELREVESLEITTELARDEEAFVREKISPPQEPDAEARESEKYLLTGGINTSARFVRLDEESLRLPSSLKLESEIKLVSQTIPEIDRALEAGLSRKELFTRIRLKTEEQNRAEHLKEVSEVLGEETRKERSESGGREDYLQALYTLKALINDERARESTSPLRQANKKQLWMLDYASQHLDQRIESAGGARAIAKEISSPLYVSLAGRGEGRTALRLPVASLRAFEAMQQVTQQIHQAMERDLDRDLKSVPSGDQKKTRVLLTLVRESGLRFQAWKGERGPEIPQRSGTREQVARFLRSYIDARLQDPETAARNRSPEFRKFQNQLHAARTPEEVNRVAAAINKENWEAGERQKRDANLPGISERPAIAKLGPKEMKLLFYGRAPKHYTAEMRDLRHQWGMSKAEKDARLRNLKEGKISPSPTLRRMLTDLESRASLEAMAHYRAQLKNYNHEMKLPGKLDLKTIHDRLGPYERDYLYQQVSAKEQALSRGKVQERTFPNSLSVARASETPERKKAEQTYLTPPKDSPAYKEYITAAKRHETQLLVEATNQFRGISGLMAEEARQQLPLVTQQQIRVQSQKLAWADIAPPEIMEENRSPEAERLDRTIAHAMEHLQSRARLAKDARQDFIDQKVREAETCLRAKRERGAYLEAFSSHLKAVYGDALLKDVPDLAKAEAARRLHQEVRQAPERASDLKHLREIGYTQLRTQDQTQAHLDRANSGIAKTNRPAADHIWTLAVDANRVGLEAVRKTRAEPLHDSPSAYKQFVTDTLHQLAPADSERLQALTAYSQRASEDFFRVFPEIDRLRRAIDLGRSQQLSDRTQSLERARPLEAGHPERASAAEGMRSVDEVSSHQERAKSMESVADRERERSAVASDPRSLPRREDHHSQQTPPAPQIEVPDRIDFSWGR